MSVINTNTKALAAQGSLSNVNNKLATSMERLSTGLRINSAKDDAAGLAITNRMTSDIRGFAVAIRNANDGLSMAQTAEGAIGQVTDMLQRMRELAVQASNGSMNADNRAASQLEVAQLKAQIDDVAKQTNFNSIKLLDGSAGAIKLQTGVKAGELMTMSIESVQTKDIGLGSRASLTSTGFFNATAGSLAQNTAAGDLTINGVTIRASAAADDLLSSSDKSSSAIAKVAAINAASAQTGVVATLGNTTVAGSAMTAAAGTGTITVNGVATASFSTTADAGASRAVTVAAINAITAQTGVRAIDTGDLKKGVVLVADDARNITVAFGTHTAATTGVGAVGVYSGTYQLSSSTNSPIQIGVSSNGDLTKAGLTAGTYSANVSAMTSVDRAVGASTVAPSAATTGILEAGTLRINGTSIVAASTDSDTASDTTATSSTKAASAIAIAAAINKATAQTGVTATAAPNEIVGSDFTALAVASYSGKTLAVNGTAISLTSLSTLSTVTRSDVANLINQYTGQTGVVATDNGRGLSLVASDGRNISLGTDLAAESSLGLKTGSAKLSAASVALAKSDAVTTYSRVSLSSDKSFTLEGGSDGNDTFTKLGFKTGTYGGVDNGVKVASIDISTQAGAQVALTSLDAALKSVSFNQAKLGAFQNRLDAVISNLTEVNQNMSASRSRIQDTDYAAETTNLAKSQIIQQAATAMLAQANQSSQSVLSLLK
jgi:flagellin